MNSYLLILFICAPLLAGTDSDAAKADPAPAAVWDVASPVRHWTSELPEWLKVTGEIRGRLDSYFGVNGVAGRDDSYYLHRLRLDATAAVSPWLQVVAEGQDARQAGYDRTPVPYTIADPLDLRRLYVELGRRKEEAPWNLRIGRQPLIFGDMRLVSTSNWGNVGPNFDGVRLSVRENGMRLDGFASRVVVPCEGFDRPRPDRMLSGFYSSFDVGGKAATVDAYVFWKKNLHTADLFTYGLRMDGRAPWRFDYKVETAIQRGTVAAERASAWAGHWEIGRRWPGVRGALRVAAEYNYATGDRDPGDGRYQSFDSLYPTNIYATAGDFGWRNLHEAASYAEWQLDPKTKVRTAYHFFRLAEVRDALYTFSGAVFASAPRATARGVGSELDLRWVRQMSRSLQFWVGYAHLFPGPYLKQAGKGAVDYPYAMWTLSF